MPLLVAVEPQGEDVQTKAVEQLKKAIPPETVFDLVEATNAAEMQGAVHYLSLVIPADLSIFSDIQGNDTWKSYQTLKSDPKSVTLGY